MACRLPNLAYLGMASLLACHACAPAGDHGFIPYETAVEFWVESSEGTEFHSSVVRAAQRQGYIEADFLRATYVVDAGYERLMAFSATPCGPAGAATCSEDQGYMSHNYVFIDREAANGRLWIRVLRWCGSSCQLSIDRLAADLRVAIEQPDKR